MNYNYTLSNSLDVNTDVSMNDNPGSSANVEILPLSSKMKAAICYL